MDKSLALWFLLASSAGPQPTPTEVVQVAVQEVVQVVQDAEPGRTAAPERRRLLLQRVAERLFDFPEMARRALAQHWRERTAGERAEFVALFKEILGRAYLGKLENYASERIVYTGETVDGEFATVRSRIITGRGEEIAVDYRLQLVGSRWAVFDIAVSGMSFVNSYRSQFNRIIQTSSYATLVRQLRLKLPEPAAGMAGR